MIVNIDNDTHRIFLSRLIKLRVKFRIVWKNGKEYCLDTLDYDDYVSAKQLQINMGDTYKNVPIV